ERTAKLVWVGVVAGFLTLELVMCLVAATLAAGDPSFAVVPGYHEQALHWDETVAARRASDALGWTADVTATEADALGRRSLTVTLRDRRGQAVSGAAVEAELFHHARAGEVRTVPFAEAAAGTYETTTEMRRDGLWELRLSARRGDDRFVRARSIELGTDGKG
ncbi:MAG TPA: FixH family protein, partial [Planctomycetaceae bacterium]